MNEVRLSEASISSYLSIIEGKFQGTAHIFRGQADASWDVIPKLYRKRRYEPWLPAIDPLPNYEKMYEKAENQMLYQFFNYAHPYLKNQPRQYFNDRILAQHYGVPTKLLDWSDDPLVALFFAIDEYWSKEDIDAAIYCLRNPIFLTLDVLHRLQLDGSDINEQTRELINELKLISLRPPIYDPRILAQKSVFTIQCYGGEHNFVPLNHRPNISPFFDNDKFYKIIIPNDFKHDLYIKLLDMGINKQALFPSLEGIGNHINVKYDRDLGLV